MFGYHTYERVPKVVCLPVHLPNTVWLTDEEDSEELPPPTSLSPLARYFCRPAGDAFDGLRYYEYFEQFMVAPKCPKAVVAVLDAAPPGQQHFVYDRCRREEPVCRLEMKYPKQKEIFYLRHMLLNFPKRSWEECKCHNGRAYSSFEEAMLATGCFARSDEASQVLEELVALRYTGAQLRFAFLVLLEQDATPLTLYRKYEHVLLKDYLHGGLSMESAQRKLKQALRATWLSNGNAEVGKELPWDTTDETLEDAQAAAPSAHNILGAQIRKDLPQAQAANHILRLLEIGEEAYIFVEGRSGTGKSTLAKYLHSEVTASGKTVLNVATTGLAALQLSQGATAHSTFGIPLQDEDCLPCRVGMHSAQGKKIAGASLIQWDEWPSTKATAWDAVLRLLDELRAAHPSTFVPKVFVCYGDFRQIPPVVPRGSRQDIVSLSVRASPSWRHFVHFRLTTKHRQASDVAYARWLDNLGEGTLPTHACNGVPGAFVELSPCDTVETEDAAIAFCFPAVNDPHDCSRARVVAPTNSLVDAINDRVLETLVRTYKRDSFQKVSADTMDLDEGSQVDANISQEFLNMQRQPGAPPHCLRLVTGALYELMRNFSAEHRLMNHSVVILKSVHEHHVCIETLQGESFPLPRICFRMAMAGSNSTMCRRQYPLRPAYAATFNGCQGTTLDRCTVDLRRCPFTHGHLYVALSRVRSKANVWLAPDTT